MGKINNIASQRTALMILMVTGLFVVSQVYMLIPLTNLFAHYFSVSNKNVLWMISAYGFAYASGFLLIGPLSDLFGRKRIMVVGLIFLSIITFSIGYVHSFGLLIILRILQGLSASSFPPTAMAYVGEFSSDALRIIGLSFLIMAFSLSTILGQVYGSWISQALSWQWAFWLLAGLYIIMLFLITFKLDDTKKENLKAPIIGIYRDMLVHLRNFTLLPLYFTTFIILMSFVAIYSVLGGYLNLRFGLDPEKIIYIRMAGIPSICLSPVSGYFARKIGGNRVSIFGLGVLILGILCEALSPSLVYFTLSSALFDAGIAITAPGVVSLINKIANHAKASAMSLYTFFLFIGAGLGPLVAEQLFKLGFSGICYIFLLVFASCIFALQFTVRKVKTI